MGVEDYEARLNQMQGERDGWREEAQRLARDIERLASTCADTTIGQWLKLVLNNILVAAYPDVDEPKGDFFTQPPLTPTRPQ